MEVAKKNDFVQQVKGVLRKGFYCFCFKLHFTNYHTWFCFDQVVLM